MIYNYYYFYLSSNIKFNSSIVLCVQCIDSCDFNDVLDKSEIFKLGLFIAALISLICLSLIVISLWQTMYYLCDDTTKISEHFCYPKSENLVKCRFFTHHSWICLVPRHCRESLGGLLVLNFAKYIMQPWYCWILYCVSFRLQMISLTENCIATSYRVWQLAFYEKEYLFYK